MNSLEESLEKADGVIVDQAHGLEVADLHGRLDNGIRGRGLGDGVEEGGGGVGVGRLKRFGRRGRGGGELRGSSSAGGRVVPVVNCGRDETGPGNGEEVTGRSSRGREGKGGRRDQALKDLGGKFEEAIFY